MSLILLIIGLILVFISGVMIAHGLYIIRTSRTKGKPKCQISV